LVLCGALLHDIGHGPFSHASEEILGYDHETWTQRVIGGQTQVNQLLRNYDARLPHQLQELFTGKFAVPLVCQLISGQLDCDRLDYLLRDSYFTGAQYGHLDLDRIIAALDYDPTTRSLVVRGRKSLVAVEHYLVVRFFMHTQVYNHPKNLAARFVLSCILRRARECVHDLWVDEVMGTLLLVPPQQWSLSNYLAADDVIFNYHFQRWQSCSDPILADLCRQLVDRDLPKAWEVSTLSNNQRRKLLERLEGLLSEMQMTPSGYYIGLKEARIKGYSLYDKGIYLKSDDGQGLQEIADCSNLVRSLALTDLKMWLVYPRALREQVGRIVQIEKAVASLS
jgi:HD superfamily phosphohydrolase